MVILGNTKNGESRGVPSSKAGARGLSSVYLSLHNDERVFPMSSVQLYRLWRTLCEAAQVTSDSMISGTKRLVGCSSVGPP